MSTKKEPKAPKAPKVKPFTNADALKWALKASSTKQIVPHGFAFFNCGQVRCSNGLVAMGAPISYSDGNQAVTAILGAANLKDALKAGGKAEVVLTGHGRDILFTAGAFSQVLEGAESDFEFPYEDPSGTEAVPEFDFLPGLKEAFPFMLDKAPDEKPYLTSLIWQQNGVLVASDGNVLHNAWAGGSLYGGPVTLSEAFVKIISKEKTPPARFYATGNSITAVWPDGRWLQGPSNDGRQFRADLDVKGFFQNFKSAHWTPIPEGLKEAAAAIKATADATTMTFYDGAGKLWTLPTEEGPSVEIDMGDKRLAIDATILERISACATEWALTPYPGVCYYRGVSCRGAFNADGYTKLVPKTDDAPDLSDGLTDPDSDIPE